jgi:hypothetical protein
VTNRWIRLLLAVLAIAAASAAAYRIAENEQRLAHHTTSARTAALSAQAALSAVDDLKASLHAYVAPGQGVDFWSTRARGLLDTIRGALLELDASANAAGGSMAEALDACDRLAAAEQRAHGYMQDQQALLAGDVIFTEGRDLIDVLRGQIAITRDQLAASASRAEIQLRREQLYLVAGGAAVLALVMLLLLPTTQSAPPQVIAITPALESEIPPAPALEPASPQPAPKPVVDTAALAGICSELAAAATSAQIGPLLDRARTLLEARGVIVWMGTDDRAMLYAAAASGYDERVVARIGSISRGDTNLTADAFRENVVRTSVSTGSAAAALAIPLPAPGGPAGVFAAELSPGAVVDEAKLGAAGVIAAQLGAVLGVASAKLPDEAGDAPSTAAARWSP